MPAKPQSPITNKAINLLNLVVLLILILPYSYYLGHEHETQALHWIPNFILFDINLALFFLPIPCLTIGFQIAKTARWRTIFLVALIIISALYAFFKLFIISFPIIPDYSTGIGSLLLLSICPLAVFIFIQKRKQEQIAH